ncbi:MAG: alanine dehydrogenase [Calditrichaeota bacterium]|nr:MAG: alanine dehydrogenase [Calditrichota bacterium]
MNIGIPKEVRPLEKRVGLTPPAVDALVRAGHTVIVEHEAGLEAGFKDEDYLSVGAQIVYSHKEACGRADMVVKIGRPTEEEYPCFHRHQIIMSYLHLAVASPDLLEVFEKEEITAIGYETIQTDEGRLPVLEVTSEVAGRMAPIIAGELLDSIAGGRGILISGIPGVAPAAVVVLGGGVLGFNAARAFYNMGAQVMVLDKDRDILRMIDNYFNGKISTMLSSPHNIAKAVSFADILVCAAAVPGGRAPTLVTREMLTKMRPKAVILDYAINSGGNVETSRPTTLANPWYLEENIIHYCVPNVPARVARSASYAFSNAALPFVLEIANEGITQAMKHQPALRRGVNVFEGKLIHAQVAAAMGKKAEKIE